jgi:hypothetical protein
MVSQLERNQDQARSRPFRFCATPTIPTYPSCFFIPERKVCLKKEDEKLMLATKVLSLGEKMSQMKKCENFICQKNKVRNYHRSQYLVNIICKKLIKV